MNTTENVHGHEVLRLVQESADPPTRAELETELIRIYGPNARFCTCSTAEMTCDQLLSFLLSQGKLVENQGRLTTNAARICNHPEGEPHHD